MFPVPTSAPTIRSVEMSSNIVNNNASVNFTILSDEAAPKNSEKLIKTDLSKSDDPEEDEVFANDNETNRNQSLKVEGTSNENCNAPSVITSTSDGVKSHVVVSSATATSLSDTGSSTSVAISPTTTNATTRRPSYTSKAPSALVNLPKTIDEIENNSISNSASNNLQTFNLNVNGVDILQKRNNSITEFTQSDSDHHRNSAKELLHLHAQKNNNYESLDEYSNPGTPGSNNSSGILCKSSSGNIVVKLKQESKYCQDVLHSGKSWETAASADVLTVRCREHIGELHRHKFGSGSKGKSIKVGDKWVTPIEFEHSSGRASCKDWKRSIRFHGQHLQKLIEDQNLMLHAISCTCGICRGDDTLNGPVKLFQSVKRKGSQLNSPRLKKKSFSDEYKGFRERLGSYSVDGDVFSMAHDDGNMPPMTPLTPMTPIAPHTPFGANCMTPLAVTSGIFRSCSPPKSVTLQVPPVTQTNPNPVTSIKTDNSSISSSQYTLPPPTSTKITQAEINNQQHWIQLEEMATNLVSIANKLKLMIEQVKIQTEASKDSAVTQAKIQAESDKAEAVSLVRRGQFQHIIQNTPITTTADQQTPTQSQQYMVQVSKICQNCGREAYLECTGCYRSYYCGQFCQQKDWIAHKTKCRELVAEEIQQTTTVTTQISGD